MLVEYLLSAMVQDLVDSYFVIQKEGGTSSPMEELVVPDGTHGILFVEKGQILRSSAGKKEAADCLNQMYVFGQKSAPVTYRFDSGPVLAYGAKLKPNALKSCFKLPASELTDQLMPADQLLSKEQRAWCDRIYEIPTLVRKMHTLDRFLQLLAQTPSRQKVLADIIVRYIHQNQGQIGIQQISERFGLNYKYLERLFKDEIGLNPKMYCRIIRFNASLMWELSSSKLTDLAYSSGYFDQMHFIKEVKAFTGLLPSEFFSLSNKPIAREQFQGIKNRLSN